LSVLSFSMSVNSTFLFGLADAVSVLKSTDVDDSRLALFNTYMKKRKKEKKKTA